MMKSPLQKITLKNLCNQPIMIDANIFMVGIENRNSDVNCSFENIKELFLVPMLESFSQIYLHEVVYGELDQEAKCLVDSYKGKNITIVSEGEMYDKDPQYNVIFNNIANHELVQYIRPKSKDRGEVYSLAYAARNGINYFSSREIMVDNISKELPDLADIEVITFDVILLLAFIYHNSKGDSSKNKALKSIYKRYCDDVIRRHKLPTTLREYIIQSQDYI